MWVEMPMVKKAISLAFKIAKKQDWSQERLEKQVMTILDFKKCKHTWAWNGRDSITGWEKYLCKECLIEVSVRGRDKTLKTKKYGIIKIETIKR